MKLRIKPLSVNAAWKGRRFKTDKYKAFEKVVLLSLPNKINIPDGKIKINYTFGFSSILSDIDNAIKQFQDILCKKYSFDDRDIYEIHVKKKIVKKGQEFIEFEIEEL